MSKNKISRSSNLKCVLLNNNLVISTSSIICHHIAKLSPNSAKLVWDSLNINFFTTCPWLVHNLFMACSWLTSLNLFINYIWLLHNLFCSGPVRGLLMTYPQWLICYLLMTCSCLSSLNFSCLWLTKGSLQKKKPEIYWSFTNSGYSPLPPLARIGNFRFFLWLFSRGGWS